MDSHTITVAFTLVGDGEVRLETARGWLAGRISDLAGVTVTASDGQVFSAGGDDVKMFRVDKAVLVTAAPATDEVAEA